MQVHEGHVIVKGGGKAGWSQDKSLSEQLAELNHAKEAGLQNPYALGIGGPGGIEYLPNVPVVPPVGSDVSMPVTAKPLYPEYSVP